MVNTLISIPGYQISEEIYNGSRTLVYRGYQEIDSLPVVIKLLKNPYPSFSELVQFSNQYTIAKNLHQPGIIQTYSLEAYQNSYVLVMEDYGGVPLKNYFANDIQMLHLTSVQDFLEIAIAICSTLDILFQERIIHKDIKPSNILINPQTKQVKLIDFSIASLLPRETQTLVNPNVLEGTLAYISPEQTGRMNRGIDYRTDFYSLGVTFYELLTGELPFPSNDLMELVHFHIAKPAPLVHEINPQIPSVLSAIVSKLMAKNSEDRYQSALGLKFDLETCLHQLKETGRINYFEIARRDVCDRFLIPDKIYGRETEIAVLLQAFERVSIGTTEMMLVAGCSGIGKTAIVNEIHKLIVRQRGYFIKGKFDQFNRNIPFSAFVQVFRDLMEQLLTESDTQIQQWRNQILEAVGENGEVIIKVIPELERIIGQQLPAPELSGTAAQNRFNLLFQKFTQVFTTAEHPLVMFLDDLQWADSASLKLMQLLMADTGHLLLIGAYRDHETCLVNEVHPLMLTLNEIQKTSTTINTITLRPLSQTQVNQLVADTLKCSENLALPLALLVSQKTQGNPFFATQFLKALHQNQLIQFNFELGHWQCDITQVSQQAVTDDVVAFMAFQLQRLPQSTQEVLQLAACIGNQFDLTTLAIVAESSEIETAACLWKALQEGLILPQSEVYKFFQGNHSEALVNNQVDFSQSPSYKFLHDRIQQAAYSLIPTEYKQSTHLKIGKLLLHNIPESEREEKIFEIVNQLNVGVQLITQNHQLEQLVQLNLMAGRKAKNSTAYAAAVSYLNMGLEILTTNSWQTHYDLTLALHIENIEAQYLKANFAAATALTEIVLKQANNLLDRVRSHELQIQICVAQRQPHQAIDIGLQTLELLGYPMLTELDSDSFIMQLPDLEAEFLEMTDPYQLAAMRILKTILSPILAGKPEILPLAIISQIKLCIQYGLSDLATGAYVWYGTILCGGVGNIQAGYDAGQLALKLLKHFDTKNFKCSTYNMFYTFIQHWQEHLRNSFMPLVEGVQSGIEIGDYEYAGYCATNYCIYQFLAGENLYLVEKKQSQYSELLLSLKLEHSFCNPEIWHQLSLNLLGNVVEPLQLIGQSFDEKTMLEKLHRENNYMAVFFTHLVKMILLYLLQEPDQAISNALQAKEYSLAAMGTEFFVTYNFYQSLAVLVNYTHVSKAEQQQYLIQVSTNQEKMLLWANHAPMNYRHKYDLVAAETARIAGNHLQAIEDYDRAISGAKANAYIQEEAIANELAAKFYLDWGKETIAQAYMHQAYYCYARWGAKAKTNDLEKRYPQLLQPILQQQRLNLNTLETIAFPGTSSSNRTSSTASTSVSDVLDFTSVLKAAQAISSSIELDQLIDNLNRTILENSGAKKAVLLLPQAEDTAVRELHSSRQMCGDTWQVRAITFIEYEEIQTILTPQALDNCPDIPIKIINYVRNTQQTVVIDNCKTDIPGLIGKYMLSHQPQSVLCTPIINQGNLVGIVYLENSLIPGVFTNHRLNVINLLSSQAAISLENAQLYQQAQQSLQDLQQAQVQIVQSEKMSALGNLVAGVAHEMNNPLGFIAASLKQAKPTFADIVGHLKLYQQSLPNPNDEILEHAEEIDLEYTLEDLPKIIEAMVMACDRLKNISTSLRTFSRADKDYKVPFNIHEGIDSTILILKHRLKANEQRPAIAVVTHYGNLPQVDCFPGQLNQVFMNIIANAIDALDEANLKLSPEEIKAKTNKITVTTLVENQQVKIIIADNANGMSAEVKQKVFDHLFTTKGVGKGTGLGLAIARQIVEESHNGKLSFNSVLGEGTEFIIEIPV
ncbi:MAG: AAA family ATPase [Goleter apudmare HA4340-LM2]|jgi:predicted ATPase/signal transduction histidine kinase|nr:AAA family ATPase [Goleter apudmare HA4340-LM2]